MAAIVATPQPLAPRRNSELIVWTPVTENDTATAVDVSDAAEMSVQFEGTFGGATVVLQGSNDGSHWYTLLDSAGAAVSTLAAKLVTVLSMARYVRPSASGGTGQTLTVSLLVRRAH